MLDAGVPVNHHRPVHRQGGSALGIDVHALLARRLDDPLPRVTTQLVVALYAEAAERLDAAEMPARLLEVVEERTLGVARAVQNESGGKDAWPKDLASFDELLVAEDQMRRCARIVGRGDTVGEI